MQKLIVDTLTLRDWTTNVSSPYNLQAVPGFEAPDFRIGSYDKPGEDGARITTALYGPRPITISGEVHTTDIASYAAARQALAYAFRIQRDKYNYPSLTRIAFTTLDGASYFLDAQVKSFKNPLWYPTTSSFIATLTAPDPAIYGATQQTTGRITIQTGGGASFPLTFPIIFTAGTGGTGNLNNSGNLNTWPLIYLTGAVTNPRIYALEVGGTIQLTYTTVNANDVIVIDMLNKTVMLNGTISLLQYMTTDSNWFSLAVGNNTFRFTSGSLADTGTMEVKAYPAFIGI